MIFIVVKFKVSPNNQENWLSITKDFTDATRSETGNLWYEGHAASTTRPSTCSWRPSATRRRARSTSPRTISVAASNPCAPR